MRLDLKQCDRCGRIGDADSMPRFRLTGNYNDDILGLKWNESVSFDLCERCRAKVAKVLGIGVGQRPERSDRDEPSPSTGAPSTETAREVPAGKAETEVAGDAGLGGATLAPTGGEGAP